MSARIACCAAMAIAVACGKSVARAAPSGAAAPSSSPPTDVFIRTGVRVSQAFIPQRGQEALRAFVADVPADETGGECSLTRTGGSGATWVSAWYPTRAAARMQVNVTFDSAGRLVRYSERRGVVNLPRLNRPSAEQLDSLVRASEAAMRSTSINLDYAIDQAIVSNRGGGKPSNAVLATVRDVERLEKLGPPAARLERMRKLCGV